MRIANILRFFTSIALFGILAACSSDEKHPMGWEKLDLLAHGLPVSIMAPPEAKVQAGSINSSILKDITIDGKDNYHLQIFYGTALTNDIAKLKNDLLSAVTNSPYFTKLIKEDAAGFIYETKIDETPAYGFRYVKIQGDTEINFQTSYNYIFTREQAEQLYQSVQ